MSDSARPSMDLFGEALRDFFDGERPAQVHLRRDDGLDETLPISIFFQRLPELTAIERQTLSLSSGRVLDIGAGAGRHTLILQETGRRVTALDVSHDAVEVMKLRGVRNPIHGDLFAFSGGPFDTLLLLMRSVGMAGDLDGLKRFFGIARGLLSPGGSIVTDAVDYRKTDDPTHLAYHEANRLAGRYGGEVRLTLHYKGQSGLPYRWLLVDPETLTRLSLNYGFTCQVRMEEASGLYLAQLTLHHSQ